jgi:hypothetical protein
MDEVHWFDRVGDMLQAEGVRPEDIFEFHDLKLSCRYQSGGLVVARAHRTKHEPSVNDFALVIVRRTDCEIETLTADVPFVRSNAAKIASRLLV